MMRHTSAYFIRLGLELDGELIEERFVEPGEIVHIGHEQRTNLLCWGRLPRTLKLFRYVHGEPVVLISPQWLTSQSSLRPVSPRAHPSSRSIPTPLPPGECFTLDLDGALLHVEHCLVHTQLARPFVPSHAPRAGSDAARRIALTSVALCSMLWALSAVLWAGADPALKSRAGRQVTQVRTDLPSAKTSAPVIAPAGSRVATSVGASISGIPVQVDSSLSWQAREVQRLLQRRTEHYRACFDEAAMPTQIIFELGIEPATQRSRIASVQTSNTSDASDVVMSCLTQQLHKTELPHYQDPFTLQFHVIFDPELD